MIYNLAGSFLVYYLKTAKWMYSSIILFWFYDYKKSNKIDIYFLIYDI